jgi:hypothetical protein
MTTTGSETNIVKEMQPEFVIFLALVSAHKKNTFVACVVGVANFVVYGKGTKL